MVMDDHSEVLAVDRDAPRSAEARSTHSASSRDQCRGPAAGPRCRVRQPNGPDAPGRQRINHPRPRSRRRHDIAGAFCQLGLAAAQLVAGPLSDRYGGRLQQMEGEPVGVLACRIPDLLTVSFS